eukprot:scaffold93226_cov20-Cyclotella_meneghiniana.AAC.1
MVKRNNTFIGRILKEAGVAAHVAFRSVHKSQPRPKSRTPRTVRFVYKGNFYRRTIPTKKKDPPQLLKLPPAGQAVMPQPFVTPPPDVVEGAAEAIA